MDEKEIEYLVLENGTCPFEEWLDSLTDKSLQLSIDVRLARVRGGNLGDYKSLGDGVFEFRITKGPGLRIYFGFKGSNIIIILTGGNKSTQRKDIQKAKGLWAKYLKLKQKNTEKDF